MGQRILLSIHRTPHEIVTVLGGRRLRGSDLDQLDTHQRAQLVADLLSLPQPELGRARAVHLAAWLIRVESGRYGREFVELVARRIVTK